MFKPLGLAVSSAGFGLVLRLSFIQSFFLFIYIVVVDCILVGVTIATLVWYDFIPFLLIFILMVI